MQTLKPVKTIYGESFEKNAALWQQQVEQLKEKFGTAIEQVLLTSQHPTDVPIVFVRGDSLVSVLRHLKTDPAFDYSFLSDITATDEWSEGASEPRFHVVYNLASRSKGARIRVKVRVAEGASVPTATGVWPGANWPEREVYDMFGVRFEGHPDLRRILMDYRWEGHPLRKDYPLKGYQIFPDSEPPRPELLE